MDGWIGWKDGWKLAYGTEREREGGGLGLIEASDSNRKGSCLGGNGDVDGDVGVDVDVDAGVELLLCELR